MKLHLQYTCMLMTQNYIVKLNQGLHSFSFFELKTFLKTFFTTLTTYSTAIVKSLLYF